MHMETTQGQPVAVLTARVGREWWSWAPSVPGLRERGDSPADARTRLGLLAAEVLPGLALKDEN